MSFYRRLNGSKKSVLLISVRRVTPREAAGLQGFSDSFILHPNDDKAYYLVGNSVSIKVVKAVALEVIHNCLSSAKQVPGKKAV